MYIDDVLHVKALQIGEAGITLESDGTNIHMLRIGTEGGVGVLLIDEETGANYKLTVVGGVLSLEVA